MPNVSKSKYRKVSLSYLSVDRSGDVDQSKLPKTAANSPKKHSLPIMSWTMVGKAYHFLLRNVETLQLSALIFRCLDV